MEIDRKLNLVVTVDRDTGPLYVHSVPISRAVFDQYFIVIAKTFAAIYEEGLKIIAGPRVAAMMLRKIAREMGVWEGAGGVDNGLMAEIRRLSNVMLPTDAGWASVPLEDAITKGLLDEDEVSEVEGIVTFFICTSAMNKRRTARALLEEAAGLWGAQTTLLSFTEYSASLRTLTATVSSGAAAGSSVPS